ncbi:MAG TPA: SprT family zinc-dependent metalloprotease [Candidatus Limnocylindrales bacterium]|jgi:predicted metal-dependent hydrolase|nr:SprT family zinc-dependent metalloprotease [Candidatus Limnocylindrales bacterium]
MQFEFPFRLICLTSKRAQGSHEEWLRVGGRKVRLHLVSNHRARRYILRLQNDGTARVTIPRRGSAKEAARFAASNVQWLEKQLLRQARESDPCVCWQAGTEILFRGDSVPLEAGVNGESGLIRFGDQVVRLRDPAGDVRPQVENHLRALATYELATRTAELATRHAIPIRRVTVGNQRSRWGSCSRHGTISLNWRLVQVSPFVRDYIILHELAHVKEMNHSRRFWREVERLCPEYRQAEQWLKLHSAILR